MTRRDTDRFLPLSPVSLHILLALADGRKHGYAVMKEVARRASRLDPAVALRTE